ncbi:hypothetical protein [Mycobacterium servetii]|uniref:Uncharacterized protein n=1 Tax=Mycobacterium servetii TaxID=3237418 RepID=A0ABV4C9A9_9MYCO
MITMIATAMGGGAPLASAHVTTLAAPLWDIGANLKTQGIKFAEFLLMGGTALVSACYFFIGHDKTKALKAAAIGVVLMGVVSSLPALGIVSTQTVSGLTQVGYR